MRVVFDTNTLISAVLLAQSIPDRAFRVARSSCSLLFSDTTFDELQQVITRTKFDKYVSINTRIEFVACIARVSQYVPIDEVIKACRDPNDDKFLDVAVNGRADFIVTGDRDLLVLNPFRDIKIVTPAQFLSR